MPDRPEFQEKQYAFARHIRDPKNNPAPIDTEDRRMAIYRELFFNNLLNLLGQTFPVLKKLLTKDKWRSLIRQFMVNHEAQSPYFLEVPQEFVKFLETGYTLEDDDFPFLIELAHYEWVELALSVSDDKNDLTGIDQSGDLLAGIPVASRLAWAFSYQFAVHRINAKYLPREPGEQPTCLAICRNSNDDMDFMELNPVTVRLFELIGDNTSASGRDLLTTLAAEIQHPDPETLIPHGLDAMQQMLSAEILLGVK
ncbi:MAG: putative DNA-binding domain-containing protein [Woeseiaceae bacterium]|nr:putative DNA-binding domain-containing protein [Woeseiaceae bacterium]